MNTEPTMGLADGLDVENEGKRGKNHRKFLGGAAGYHGVRWRQEEI